MRETNLFSRLGLSSTAITLHALAASLDKLAREHAAALGSPSENVARDTHALALGALLAAAAEYLEELKSDEARREACRN